MRDLDKMQCGIRENVDGIRDLGKIQCGIRENVDGIRDLTATRDPGFGQNRVQDSRKWFQDT